MEETFQKNDFAELEYSGMTEDRKIFDSNIGEKLKEMSPNANPPFRIICIGQNMLLKAVDDFLINKTPGNYTLELPPEKAFGNRKKELVKIMPLSVFSQQKIIPQNGMVFAFDNMLGKITAVSGGRVIVDFNNPIAGKPVIYELKIIRKILNIEEKIKALMVFYFGRDFTFKTDGKKLVIEAEKNIKQFLDLFKAKFKEILDLDLEIKEIELRKEAEESSVEKIEEKNQKEPAENQLN